MKISTKSEGLLVPRPPTNRDSREVENCIKIKNTLSLNVPKEVKKKNIKLNPTSGTTN